MRLLSLVPLTSLFLASAAAHAQPAADSEIPTAPAPPPPLVRKEAPPAPMPSNGITVNPILPLLDFGGVREIQASYERVLTDHVSLMATASYAYGDAQSGSVTVHETAMGLRLHPHFYLGRLAPDGFFLAPFGSVLVASASLPDASGSALGYEAGGTLGWSWVAGAFNAKLGIGARYVHAVAEVRDATSRASTGRDAVLPALDLQVGVVF